MVDEISKIRIEEVEKKITTLQQEIREYSLLKKIFKRKKYLKKLKKTNQQIAELYKKKELYEYDIKSIDILSEAYKLEEEKRLSPVLTEKDLYYSNLIVKHTKPDIDNVEGLILVHKTNYAPTESMIKTNKESNIFEKRKEKIGEQEIDLNIQDTRNTVHFCVNSEVTGHLNGNWNDRKYAILIPFTDIPIKTIGNACSVDTYTVGNVKLTNNCWILVPKGEKEIVKQNNPNVNIIEYEGKSVTNYANLLVGMLGYKRKIADSYEWTDKESSEKHRKLMEELGLSTKLHYGSTHMYTDNFNRTMQSCIQIIKHFQQNSQLLNKEKLLEVLDEELQKYIGVAIRHMPDMKTPIIDLQNKLLSESIIISDDKIAELYENIKMLNQIQALHYISYFFSKEIINFLKNYQENIDINEKTK